MVTLSAVPFAEPVFVSAMKEFLGELLQVGGMVEFTVKVSAKSPTLDDCTCGSPPPDATLSFSMDIRPDRLRPMSKEGVPPLDDGFICEVAVHIIEPTMATRIIARTAAAMTVALPGRFKALGVCLVFAL